LRKFIVIACALLCVSASAQATPAEDAERAVIAAVNGTAAERDTLVKTAFTAFPNEAAASDQRKWLDKLARDSGGLTLISSAPQGERMVEAIVRTKRGAKFGKFVIFTSKSEPAKISNLFLLPARNPAKVKADAWPKGPLPLPRIASEIEKRAAELAAEDNFSGVVLVAKGDKLVVRRAYGLADREWRIPNRADTKFHIASIGKMFTAAAIVKLADQRQLSLDDPLAKWVPEYPHREAAEITLRQLLTHSAGIGDWDNRSVRQKLSGAEAARSMTAPLDFKPGERFGYSNAGYVLLQAVIEKATGEPFADALNDLVFKPAGMRNTGLWPVTAIVPNRATGYLHSEDDPLGLGPRYSNQQFLGYDANGSGGEYSTADDMLAFLKALASGKLLGPAATKEMLTPRIDFAGAPRPSKYGYGVDLGSCGGHPIFWPRRRRAEQRRLLAGVPHARQRLDRHRPVQLRPARRG
jgi:CubicO group peptidase (beta-lactamase class C family)